MKLFKANFKLSECAPGLPWFYTYVNLFPHKEMNIENLSYSCKQCYKYKTKSILTMYPVVVTDRYRELDRDAK